MNDLTTPPRADHDNNTDADTVHQSPHNFLHVVSHEMRTPLASIRGYTQMLEDELSDQLAPHQAEFLQAIQSSTERLLALLNDVLDIARIEAGRLELHMATVHVQALVHDVIETVYPLVQDGVDLSADVDEAAYVHADATRLRQVLLNLTSNAVKFTGAGTVNVRVYATTVHDHPAWAIAVSDTGPGIDEDFIAHLFEPFTRAPHARHEAPEGTGLGLTISRELITRMGGEITVESTVDQGSTFTVLLRH